MKTIINYRKLVIVLAIIIIAVPLKSCDKDNDDDQPENTGISGQWKFTLSPDASYQDPDTVHGLTAADFNESSSTYDEVYLYEDENQNIYGETMGYKIGGKRNGTSVDLILYEFPEGPIDESLQISDLEPFTNMHLTIDEFGRLNGHGDYIEDPDQEWTKVDTYFVEAVKINDITIPELKKSIKYILCDLASTFSSFAISFLSDGVFRPMASCYGHKSGGGYYAFGHEGPGSIFPIYTQTVYIAWEWSWCKVRKYHFKINLKDEVLTYEALKLELEHIEKTWNLSHKLNFGSYEELVQVLDDFWQNYGGFAITIAFNTHTQNASVYVNYEHGKSSDVKHHPLVEAIKSLANDFADEVFVYEGKDIHDSFHMRRSEIGCNSKIVFFYLFGTHKVNYN